MAFRGANRRGWCYSSIPHSPAASVPVKRPFGTLARLDRLRKTCAHGGSNLMESTAKEEPHPFQTIIRAYLKNSRREIRKDYSRGLQTWAVSGSGKRMSPESPCFVSTTSFCILWHYESNPYEVETEVWIVAIFELVLAVCGGAGSRSVPPKL